MPEATNYEKYQKQVTAEIQSLLADLACQPVLLIGSGLSKRYFGGPNWMELLQHLCKECPACDKDFAYYRQKHGSYQTVASALADLYHEWAWSTGKNEFPKELFSEHTKTDGFIKFKISEHLRKLTPSNLTHVRDTSHKSEIEALQHIKPHSVITTNYDQLLELIYSDYSAVIGQQILHGQPITIGEIFKIHGCVSEHQGLVLTNEDYSFFTKKRKYLSAKLLTFFSEHPVLIVGYSADDANIKSILSDIDEALPVSGDTIKNIYFVEWKDKVDASESPPLDRLVPIEDAKSVRVRNIRASDLKWVFDAFKAPEVLEKISTKTLRALMARSYELVRRDIPRKTIDVDFKMLEGAVTNSDSFAKLFGISTISDPSALNASYPYTITTLAPKLGFRTWHPVNKLFDKIKETDGLDLKTSDNVYHVTTKIGKTEFHKYSEKALALLKAVKAGKKYELRL